MLFLSESSIHVFNYCTVAIFRLTDLKEVINKRLKLVVLVLPSVLVQCSCPEAILKEKTVQPFNNIVKCIFFMIKDFTEISSSFV